MAGVVRRMRMVEGYTEQAQDGREEKLTPGIQAPPPPPELLKQMPLTSSSLT